MEKINEYKFYICATTNDYIHIKMVGAKFATESVLVKNEKYILGKRIEKAKKQLTDKENLFRKHFIE